jgi:hypothetical protein
MKITSRIAGGAVALLLAAPTTTLGTAAASAGPPHGPIVALNANQSGNWSGYNQGSIEKNGKLFDQISGTWVVPRATQHKAGEAESSSSWVGIGGGCVDAKCNVPDNTLIQAGTEQDVNKSGVANYYAWWEIIPAPSVRITNFPVHPDDRIKVDIADKPAGSNVWTITVKNMTTNKTFDQTVSYSSSHATAEWIEETPTVINSNGAALAKLPNLTRVHFDNATINGASANLSSNERIELVNSNRKVIADPSAPGPQNNSFNDCTYSTGCPAPSS